jgi:hypothetical protein
MSVCICVKENTERHLICGERYRYKFTCMGNLSILAYIYPFDKNDVIITIMSKEDFKIHCKSIEEHRDKGLNSLLI